ncbi:MULTISPECIES: hypothetical protein [unclassified Caballeronia]|uniref:hypothetical protein n=1 Tax=unclassified Caballeronia TaxID=2646786 RepID=UPI0020291F54|nr:MULTISPECIES: hypothetical protein [unclassified Caballeronia]MDR5763814.1 hypothetical protein [Caballeronia sp. LZ028]
MERLDRIRRGLTELVRIVAKLEEISVFERIVEKIESSSTAGKLVFQVFAASG